LEGDCEALPTGDREVILMGDRILYSHKCDHLPLSSQGKTLNLLLGIGDGISDGHALSSSQGKMVNLLLGISDEIGRRSLLVIIPRFLLKGKT